MFKFVLVIVFVCFSEQELTKIAPTLAERIVPEQFLQSVANELRNCLLQDVENAWKEKNLNDKIHELEELQKNADQSMYVFC